MNNFQSIIDIAVSLSGALEHIRYLHSQKRTVSRAWLEETARRCQMLQHEIETNLNANANLFPPPSMGGVDPTGEKRPGK